MLIEGMAIAAYAVGASKGYIYLRSEYPHAATAMENAIRLARRSRLDRQGRLRARKTLQSRTADRRRGLYLRRGDLAARQPGRQARPGARQAAAPRAFRPVRQADPDQQRPDPCRRPLYFGRGRKGLCRLRHGPLARHAADSARRQYFTRRADRTRVRREFARNHRGFRRRNGERASDPRGSGRRPARRLFERKRARPAAGLRNAWPPTAPCSAMAGSSSSTTRWTWRKWRVSPSISARPRAAANAPPAGSGRCAAKRRWNKIIAGRNVEAISRWCAIFARS